MSCSKNKIFDTAYEKHGDICSLRQLKNLFQTSSEHNEEETKYEVQLSTYHSRKKCGKYYATCKTSVKFKKTEGSVYEVLPS